MNSVFGRYLVAVVIGGSVFLGLHYLNRSAVVPAGTDVAAPDAGQGDAAVADQAVTGTEAPGDAAGETTATVTEIVDSADVETIVEETAPPEAAEETQPAPVASEPEATPQEQPVAEDAAPADQGDTATTTNDVVADEPAADEPAVTGQAQDTATPAPAATETPAETPASDSGDSAQQTATTETAAVTEAISGSDENGDKPQFDVVRVDNTGTAVIAGKAAPNSTVTITANGKEIGEAVASSSGEFVTILDTSTTGEEGQTQTLGLESDVDGTLQFSDETIVILPTLKSDAAEAASDTPPAAPVIVKATADTVEVVQPAAPLQVDQVSIDSISYEKTGEAAVAGRGTPNHMIIAYVDNEAVAKAEISELGSWKVVLDGLEAGNYMLRVDELDANGKVVSRMETPFQRAFPADVERAQAVQDAAGDGPVTYTVQPGNNLWVIATGRYGEGLKYHQIFAANRDKIRDPDLIYPGQVFVLPDATE